MKSYKGGSSAKLYLNKHSIKTLNNDNPNPRRGGGKKQEIKGLSSRSRLNFLHKMAKINYEDFRGRVLYISLVYPSNKYPSSFDTWKIQLQNFIKRFERRYGKVPGFWRLELDKKNSEDLYPHFHLLLFLDRPCISKQSLDEMRDFVARSWYEVCGKICDDHLSAGTRVTTVLSRKDWDRLTRYTGKKEKISGREIGTGRMWGAWHEQMLPVQDTTIEISRDSYLKLRRWFRRLAGKRRGFAPLLDQQVFLRHENALRLLEWLGYYIE